MKAKATVAKQYKLSELIKGESAIIDSFTNDEMKQKLMEKPILAFPIMDQSIHGTNGGQMEQSSAPNARELITSPSVGKSRSQASGTKAAVMATEKVGASTASRIMPNRQTTQVLPLATPQTTRIWKA